MRILLAAEESAGVRTLQAVLQSGHELLGVFTSSPHNGVGREAERRGVHVLPATDLKNPDCARNIRQQKADVLLNVHSLYVVHGHVLSEFRVGGFNLHPGPLPDYAGMNAPAWAIYNGEPRHGVTLHWMTSKIDDGYIAYQEIFDLTPGDTGLSVSMRCITLGLGLIGRLLADLALPGGPPRVPQDHSRRRYFSRQIPHGGRVPAGMTAQALHRFVRASDFAPFPSPWGTPLVPYNGEDLGLLRISLTGARHDTDEGTIRRQDNGQWWFAAADEWVALERVLRLGRSGDAAALLS